MMFDLGVMAIETPEDLGGADIHCRQSGVTDHYAHDDHHAIALLRQAVSHLNRCKRPNLEVREPVEPVYPAEDLYGIVNHDRRKPFDVREIIARIVDASDFDEFKALYGDAAFREYFALWCRGYELDDFVYQLDPEEGYLLVQSMQLSEAESFYRPLRTYPFMAGTYTPIYQWLNALIIRMTQPRLASGRIIST